MGDELRFEPKSLRSAGKDVHTAGETLDTHWQSMQATVQGMGKLFGDDMVSSLISATYEAAQGIAHDCYTSAAKGFRDFGGGLHTMADTYEHTEQRNVDDVRAVNKAV